MAENRELMQHGTHPEPLRGQVSDHAVKGKGKGKVPPTCPPVLPKGVLPSGPPRLLGGGIGAAKKKNHLVNLHWKALPNTPGSQGVISVTQDPLLLQTAEVLTAFDGDDACTESASECRREELNVPARERVISLGEEPAQGEYDLAKLQTVFTEGADVRELPTHLLEAYFKRREATVRIEAALVHHHGGRGSHSALIDDKRLQMLGILLRKYLMAHKGESERQAVLSLKKAVLRCDYKAVPQEGLSVLRTALRQHELDGCKVTAYVNAHGEAALQNLQHPAHHLLVYELLKVPQIDERLESMLFETAFDDAWCKCDRDLETLCKALQMLSNKRDLLRRFFVTAHRLGQSLNRDCRAPQAHRGFQLSALEKLAQTKSTRSPKHNLLHFVLALMPPKDCAALFTTEDIALLAKAKGLKSFTVYQDCMELVQGFHGVKGICETGRYTSRSTGSQVKIERRRKTIAPMQATLHKEAPLDPDDRFHEKMKAFVDRNMETVQKVAQACFGAFQGYKELGVFFDDLDSVYPPPRSEQDPKVDLLAVMHQLAESVRTHRAEVEQDLELASWARRDFSSRTPGAREAPAGTLSSR